MGRVSPSKKPINSPTNASYSSWVTEPTQGAEHLSMWNSRHGRPSSSCRRILASEQVRIGNDRKSKSSVSRMA
jgi:hypothetical protein